MVLITGGSFQGKTAFGRSLLAEQKSRSEEQDFSWREIDGEKAPLEELLQGQLILHYHRYLYRRLQEGAGEEEILQETHRLIQENPDCIVITQEVGCGIIPMDPGQRMYREICGRAGVLLGKHAKDVYRVCCGLSQKIK